MFSCSRLNETNGVDYMELVCTLNYFFKCVYIFTLKTMKYLDLKIYNKNLIFLM